MAVTAPPRRFHVETRLLKRLSHGLRTFPRGNAISISYVCYYAGGGEIPATAGRVSALVGRNHDLRSASANRRPSQLFQRFRFPGLCPNRNPDFPVLGLCQSGQPFPLQPARCGHHLSGSNPAFGSGFLTWLPLCHPARLGHLPSAICHWNLVGSLLVWGIGPNKLLAKPGQTVEKPVMPALSTLHLSGKTGNPGVNTEWPNNNREMLTARQPSSDGSFLLMLEFRKGMGMRRPGFKRRQALRLKATLRLWIHES